MKTCVVLYEKVAHLKMNIDSKKEQRTVKADE